MNPLTQIANLYGVTQEEINGRSRKEHISECRQAIWLYMREQGETFQRIGDYTGRSHSGVMHGIARLIDKMGVYSHKPKYQKLRQIISGSDPDGLGTWPIF